MKSKLPITMMAGMLVLAITTVADVPQTVNYQGMLLDNVGNPMPTGNYDITFTIWNDPTAADPGVNRRWTSGVQSVGVTDGQLTYQLGTAVPLPDDLFTDTLRWLGVKLGTNPELSPRTKLATVPYSYHSLRSDTAAYASVGWSDDGSVVRLENNADQVGIGTLTPQASLEVFGSNETQPLIRLSNIFALQGQLRPALEYHWEAYHFSPLIINGGGAILQYGDASGVPRNLIAPGIAYFMECDFGIGTASPAEKLDVVGNIQASGIIRSGNTLVLNGPENELLSPSGEMYFGRENPVGSNDFDSEVKVGIGTTSPTSILEVYGETDNSTALITLNHNGNLTHVMDTVFKIYNSAYGLTFMTINGGGVIDQFTTLGATPANRISSGGPSWFNNATGTELGIGTDTPERNLHVKDVMRLEPRATVPSNPSAGDIYFDANDNKLKVYDGSVWQSCW